MSALSWLQLFCHTMVCCSVSAQHVIQRAVFDWLPWNAQSLHGGARRAVQGCAMQHLSTPSQVAYSRGSGVPTAWCILESPARSDLKLREVRGCQDLLPLHCIRARREATLRGPAASHSVACCPSCWPLSGFPALLLALHIASSNAHFKFWCLPIRPKAPRHAVTRPLSFAGPGGGRQGRKLGSIAM